MADDTLKFDFFFLIYLEVSLKFVAKSPIDNKTTLVQVMAWCQTGNKPLHESVVAWFTAAYICYRGGSKNTYRYEVLNLRALEFSTYTGKNWIFQYTDVKDILCGISKAPLEFPLKMVYPYFERCVNLRAPRLTNWWVFLRDPPFPASVCSINNTPDSQILNAPVLYPTIHHFVTEMYTFLSQNGASWDICLMHCGMWEVSVFCLILVSWPLVWYISRVIRILYMYIYEWYNELYLVCGMKCSNHAGNFWGWDKMSAIFQMIFWKQIFFNENVWNSIKISLKFVSHGQLNNIPALVQIMASRQPGDKPLSDPVMVRLLKHKCVTLPQLIISPVSEGSGDVMVLRRSRPPPAARRPQWC